MQRRILAALTTLVCACDPKIDTTEPTSVITARFDPSAAVPVLPTPNDLATDPATGLLTRVPIPDDATGADRAFLEYLRSLNGFPSSATAQATFDGDLQPDSVSAATVKVFDVTANHAAVPDAGIAYVETDADPVKGTVAVSPPSTGWVPGHTYAVALLAGPGGLKGADGRAVVSSATWTFLRSEKSLVTCADLTSPDCKPATEIIPSPIKDDPAGRYADQTAKAIQLEQLRLKYKPTIEKVIEGGATRQNIVLVWTFKIADFTSVIFDPANSRIPTPNDLLISTMTGLVTIPPNAAYSPAYTEFITDYLNTLDGFPVSSAASISLSADLDPASVSNSSVLVVPVDGLAPPATANVSYSATADTISVAPPNGSWGKGRQLAVVVLGRRAGKDMEPEAGMPPKFVQTPGGGPVVGSSVWALVRSASPLVDCADLTSPMCKRTITAAPLTDGQAILLERLRRGYEPLLDNLETNLGITRDQVAIAFTFKTVSLPEATFDPSASIIPFPNNVLRTGTGGNARLALPVPDGGSALQRNLVLGLNTLDGFSLTAPIVSESSETRGALDVGELDAESLDAGTGFIRLGPPAATPPRVRPCLDCASSLLPDGGPNAGPQQLQFVPQIPLEEQATYGAWLTTDLRDVDGHRVIPSGAFALARLNNPLCDTATMTSTVPVLSDLQACGAGGAPGLEALRLGLKPLVDSLVMRGLPRTRLALAWAFTTQTTVTELQNLADAVPMLTTLLPTTATAAPIAANADGGLPLPDLSTLYGPLPSSNVGAVYLGTVTLPFALVGPGQTLAPPAAPWQGQKAPYLLTVPSGTPPAGGWPVVIFGHGLTSQRTTMIPITNALATAGFATIGIDVVWHGDRTTCTGSGPLLAQALMNPAATDDWACASPSANTMPDPVNAQCSPAGRCVRRPTGNIPALACASDLQCLTVNQGLCVAGSCEGADFARNSSRQPLINAHNFLNLGNLFAARDNFRHYALDLTQLVRVIKAGSIATAGGPALDGDTIHYVGQSLGGFNGALFSAVSPDVQRVMLNVPGSDQTGVLLESPSFGAQRSGFLGQLAPLGITPGTPQFDQLMTLIRTIFDRADPQNFILTSVNRVMPANRAVFIQMIVTDTVVPNSTTEKLIAAATSGAKMPFIERVNPSLMSLPATSRHSFLLNFTDPATTAAAQTKAATFVLTGVVP